MRAQALRHGVHPLVVGGTEIGGEVVGEEVDVPRGQGVDFGCDFGIIVVKVIRRGRVDTLHQGRCYGNGLDEYGSVETDVLLYGYGNSSGHGQNGRGVDDGRVGHEGACGVCGVFRRVENDLGRVVPVLHVLLVRAVENLLVEGVIEQGLRRVKVTSAFTGYTRVVLRVVVFECGDRACS